MSAEIQHIRGQEIRPRDGSNANAMSALAEVSRLVESGEAVGISVALQYADGSCGRVVGGFRKSWPTIGALEQMKFDLLHGDKG